MTNQPCVLVLANNHDLGEVLLYLFKFEGYSYLKESDSREGVKRVIERQPNVTLMAEEMPRLENVELLPLLAALQHHQLS